MTKRGPTRIIQVGPRFLVAATHAARVGPGHAPHARIAYGRFTPVRSCDGPTTTFAFVAVNTEPSTVPLASTL